MTTSAKQAAKNAVPLIAHLRAARDAAYGTKDMEIRERVEKEYDLLKLYLLSFGCEIDEHATDKIKFMRVGRGDAE
jgi:hypothetical protein